MLRLLLVISAGTIFAQAPLVEVQEWAYRQGLSFWWEPLGGLGLLQRGGKSLVFQEGDTLAIFDGQIWVPVDFHRDPSGRLVLGQEAAERLEGLWAPPEPWRGGRWRIGAILIDAGHGGRDPGTVSPHTVPGHAGRVMEKDIVLRAARELAFLCRNRGLAPQVVLTREDDTFLSLEERVELAHALQLEEWEIILFVSIHANASLNRQARGFEIWHIPEDYDRDVLEPGSPVSETLRPLINSLRDYEYKVESERIAELMRQEFARRTAGQTLDRGLREEAWFVVRMARMPAVLVELGFVTNEDEARLLTQEDYLKKLAEAMYDGIRRFGEELETGVGGSR